MKPWSEIERWLEHRLVPNDLDLLIKGAVEAGVFTCKSDALREFVREYFEEKENERIAAAVALYERERITLGDAARLADVDRWTMRDILREHGVELRLGLVDEADAVYEVEPARELEFGDEDSSDEESPAK
jgi:predicted HTH domain antitoxin